jgi:hypothetical protein
MDKIADEVYCKLDPVDFEDILSIIASSCNNIQRFIAIHNIYSPHILSMHDLIQYEPQSHLMVTYNFPYLKGLESLKYHTIIVFFDPISSNLKIIYNVFKDHIDIDHECLAIPYPLRTDSSVINSITFEDFLKLYNNTCGPSKNKALSSKAMIMHRSTPTSNYRLYRYYIDTSVY